MGVNNTMETIRNLSKEIKSQMGDYFSISEIYHENSKIRSYKLLKKVNIDKIVAEIQGKSYKNYYSAEKIYLPKEFKKSKTSIEEAIRKRRSIRDFSGKSLNIKELSKLLYLSYGITGQIENNETKIFLRASPSAGALYPIEIYPVIFNVKSINKGLYHYNVKNHLLEKLKNGDYNDLIYRCTLSQEMIKHTSVVLLLTAMFNRTKIKYGERGYRHIFLDAGHIGENIYLTATAMKLGVVSIGGFIDDDLNEFLDINGVDEAVIYIFAIGKIS